MPDFLNYKNDLNNPDTASVLDELSFWSSRFGILLFNQIELRRGLKILDVGCGQGFPLFELAHIYGRSCQLTGIDIWEAAIARARLKQAFYQLPNVQVIEADGSRQPFRSSVFDLIVSNLGINNWADPQAVLAECLRVAKPGAAIALTTNIKGHYREFYDVFRETLMKMEKTEYLERLRVNEDHRGTRESVCDLVQSSGFRIRRLVEDSFEIRFLDGSALLNHSLTRIGFLDGWRSVVNPDDEDEIFGVIERKLNEIARRSGELRMSVPMLYLEGEKGRV